MSAAARSGRSILPAGYTDRYSCGCIYRWDGNSYTHWCNPSCRFDVKKVGSEVVRGYRYVGWDGHPTEMCYR